MKQQYLALTNYLTALNIRERALVLLVSIAIIYALWDGLLFSQQEHYYQQLINEQEVLSEQQLERDLQIAKTTAILVKNQRTEEGKKHAIEDIQNQLQQTSFQLDSVLNKLVPPTKITELLRSLLLQTHGLKLVSLSNDPVENISLNNSNDDSQHPTNTVQSRLYKHSTTIKLTGNYQQLYQYLTALESSEWGLYWDQLHYNVAEYPNAEISIRVHTISTDEYWIGL